MYVLHPPRLLLGRLDGDSVVGMRDGVGGHDAREIGDERHRAPGQLRRGRVEPSAVPRHEEQLADVRAPRELNREGAPVPARRAREEDVHVRS